MRCTRTLLACQAPARLRWLMDARWQCQLSSWCTRALLLPCRAHASMTPCNLQSPTPQLQRLLVVAKHQVAAMDPAGWAQQMVQLQPVDLSSSCSSPAAAAASRRDTTTSMAGWDSGSSDQQSCKSRRRGGSRSRSWTVCNWRYQQVLQSFWPNITQRRV
jgi:hypothetical protein